MKDKGLETVIQQVDNPENLIQYVTAKQSVRVNEAHGITTGRNLQR